MSERAKYLEGQIEEKDRLVEALQRHNVDSVRKQNKSEISVAEHVFYELKEEKQILSLETEMLNIKQSEWYGAAAGDETEREASKI